MIKKTQENIYTTISELTAVNGESVENNLSSSSVASWPVIAEPSEIILSDGDQVKVKIEKIYESSGEDRIFGITFTPDLMGKNDNKNYNIGFGYKAWMIVPGNNPLQGDMSVARSDALGSYVIKNGTNKVLEVDINYCGDNVLEKTCSGQLFIRPGVVKKTVLGSQARNAVFSFYSGGDKNKPLKKINL